MQGHVRQGEGELAAVERAFGGEPRGLKLGEDILGDLLRGVAIIGGETVQHLLVPDPVLKHLGGGLDEVARDAGAGEAGILGAGHDGMHRVAELVEDGLHVAVREQGGLVFAGRREVADQCHGGPLVFAAAQQFAFNEAELGEMIVFALAREHVEIEQPERLAGLGVRDGIELQVADPLVGRFDALEL